MLLLSCKPERHLQGVAGAWTCESQTPREMERGQIRAAVKRKAEETVGSRPMKLIRRELAAGDYSKWCVSDLELVSIFPGRRPLHLHDDALPEHPDDAHLDNDALPLIFFFCFLGEAQHVQAAPQIHSNNSPICRGDSNLSF